MNARFIETCHIHLKYEKKPETKGSFYQCQGKKGILPDRISLGIFAQRKASANDYQKKNEINAKYKKAEEGIYYTLNDRNIHSSIWGNAEFPEFYGYGIIDERYNLYDLLVIYSDNNCTSTLDIHVFRGMGKPEYKKPVFTYLRNYITKKP
jgi:hypothetical protein